MARARDWLRRNRLSQEAAEAIDELSPLAQKTVRLDRKHEAAWGRLFDQVGRDAAIELVEVTMADSWARMLPNTVAIAVERWANGEINESEAIQDLDGIEQEARTKLADATDRISEDPMWEETTMVLWAAGNLYDHWFPAASAFVKNEPADELAAAADGAKNRLEGESDRFDEMTGRLSMPLVGDPRHWDR